MGSLRNRAGIFTAHHRAPPCTRSHQIAAIIIVSATFFLTRLFDRSFSNCAPHSSFSHDLTSHSQSLVHATQGGSLLWPQIGYGTHLAIKIYVYEENEIVGLKELLRCRDGKISADACVKGQWGTQVLRQMPYFRRSGGRDHVFVFPSDAGAHLFRSWSTYINRSIILTPEGDRTDKKDTSAFNTWKDIIIPGNVEDGMTRRGGSVVQPLPLSKRKYLANYLGRAQGKIGRLKLIELAKQYPDKECVPVILSDQAELPFQNIIDYTHASIKWPSTRIGPELLEYLESIPDEDIERMIASGRQVRCLWVYAPESEQCSAMQGIIWELKRKVRQFHESAETFWPHNRTSVNRNLNEFSSWNPPMPLP